MAILFQDQGAKPVSEEVLDAAYDAAGEIVSAIVEDIVTETEAEKEFRKAEIKAKEAELQREKLLDALNKERLEVIAEQLSDQFEAQQLAALNNKQDATPYLQTSADEAATAYFGSGQEGIEATQEIKDRLFTQKQFALETGKHDEMAVTPDEQPDYRKDFDITLDGQFQEPVQISAAPDLEKGVLPAAPPLTLPEGEIAPLGNVTPEVQKQMEMVLDGQTAPLEASPGYAALKQDLQRRLDEIVGIDNSEQVATFSYAQKRRALEQLEISLT